MAITLGTKTQFESGETNELATVVLSSDDAIVIYEDVDDSGYLKAVHIDVSSDPPSIGTPAIVSSAGDGLVDVDVCKLTSTTFLVAYVEFNFSLQTEAWAVVGTLSGTTVSFGTRVLAYEDPMTNINRGLAVDALSSTKCFYVFLDGEDSDKTKGVVLDISGTTITANSVADIDSVSTANPDVIALSSTTAIVVFGDFTTSPEPLNAYSIYGITTTFSVSSAVEVDAGPVWDGEGWSYLAKVDSTHAVAVYQDDTDTKIWGVVLEHTGTSITAGTVYELTDAAATGYDDIPTITALGNGDFMVCYSTKSGGGVRDGRIFTISVSGTTITKNGDETVFESNDIYYSHIAANDADTIVICYADLDTVNDPGYVITAAYGVVTQLYTGTNTVTYRSDLPSGVTDIKRGGMLVRSDLDTVVIGSAASNSVMLAQATSADTYGSWTDITDSHPTDEGITAVVEI